MKESEKESNGSDVTPLYGLGNNAAGVEGLRRFCILKVTIVGEL